MKSTSAFSLYIFLILSMSWISGCGGDSGPGASGASLEKGSVSLLFTDGPADDYDKILLRIHEVTLHPTDESHKVTLFGPDETGMVFDLLELRSEDFLLSINDEVPTGIYSKIRLRISDVKPIGGPCEELEVKLPSGKIDLKPQTPFEVVAGESISIRLDVDVNKSIGLHEAGRSGKCIFRPVVFVEVTNGAPTRPCPKPITGTVGRVADGGDFELELADERGMVKVHVDEETLIFGEDGLPADGVQAGQVARVAGRWIDGNEIRARVIALGELISVRGTVATTLVDGAFTLVPDEGEAVVGDLQVQVSEETIVAGGCYQEIGDDQIQPGTRATAIGKFLGDEGALRAILVRVQPLEISGNIVRIQPTDGGHFLSFSVDEGSIDDESKRGRGTTNAGGSHTTSSGGDDPSVQPVPEFEFEDDGTLKVFLPEGSSVHLVGDGPVDIDALRRLVECKPRAATATLVSARILTASSLQVHTDSTEGVIDEIDLDRRILIVSGTVVQVRDGASILDLTEDDETELIPFDALATGDKVKLFGLTACASDEVGAVEFHATVVVRDGTLVAVPVDA